MNSNTLDKTKDPGKDGTVYPSGVFAARNERVAKDVVGFSLGYYGGDYSPIAGNPAEAAYAGTAFGNGADDLFNGNIRHMVTAIEGLAIQGYAYRYDQLQRIKQMRVYRANDVQSLFAWTNSGATDDYFSEFEYDRNGNLVTLNRNGIGTELDMDRFVYNYHTLGGQPSNRLSYVEDGGTDYGSYEDIKSGQTTGNYTYNKIGELIEDVSEDMELVWRTGDHKLSKIIRNDQDSPQIEFHYNPFGQRSMKVEKPRSGGSILNPSNWKYTYYAYDANGQVMAVYTGNFQGSSEQVKLSEQHLYGAERLGMINRDLVVFDNGVTSYTHKEEDIIHEDERGRKRYELTNHLGNVLAVINDRKIWNATDGNYEPVMLSWSDFYAFGMQMPGRNGGVNYRYLFNGMEHDGEVSGNGNSYTTEFRQYDPRLGRWKSLDPLKEKAANWSPYRFAFDNPIVFSDQPGTYELQRIIVSYADGTTVTVVRVVNNRFLKGEVHKVPQKVFGIPTSAFTVELHYFNFETIYHLTEAEFLSAGGGGEDLDLSKFTPQSQKIMGKVRQIRYIHILGNPSIIETQHPGKDQSYLIGITISGQFGDNDGKDSKTTAKHTVEVSQAMIDMLKLLSKDKKYRGNPIDWKKYDEAKTMQKIAKFADKNIKNAEKIFKEWKAIGGKESPTVHKWGDGFSDGKSRGKSAFYSQNAWKVSDSGDFLINKTNKSTMVVVPDGYEIHESSHADNKGYTIKEKK